MCGRMWFEAAAGVIVADSVFDVDSECGLGGMYGEL